MLVKSAYIDRNEIVVFRGRDREDSDKQVSDSEFTWSTQSSDIPWDDHISMIHSFISLLCYMKQFCQLFCWTQMVGLASKNRIYAFESEINQNQNTTQNTSFAQGSMICRPANPIHSVYNKINHLCRMPRPLSSLTHNHNKML